LRNTVFDSIKGKSCESVEVRDNDRTGHKANIPLVIRIYTKNQHTTNIGEEICPAAEKSKANKNGICSGQRERERDKNSPSRCISLPPPYLSFAIPSDALFLGAKMAAHNPADNNSLLLLHPHLPILLNSTRTKSPQLLLFHFSLSSAAPVFLYIYMYLIFEQVSLAE